MGMLDSIIQKGEDLTNEAVDWTSSTLHSAADSASKVVQTVENKAAAAGSAVKTVVHKVEDAAVSVGQTVKKDLTSDSDKLSASSQKMSAKSQTSEDSGHGALATIESFGSSVLSTTGKVLTALGHEAENIGLGTELMTVLFPAGALVPLAINTWKDLSSGNTLAIDKKGTAAQQIQRSGFEITNSGGTGGDGKLDLNNLFKEASGQTSSGGGPGAFDQVTAQQWQAILPVLTAPINDASKPQVARTAATGSSDTGLPDAQVGPNGIDFSGDKVAPTTSDAGKEKGDGKVTVVNGVVHYSDSGVKVAAKDGQFTAQQADGYTFKSDGSGGRLVYLHGQEIFDLKADGTRVITLASGVTVTASADGKNVSVDAAGQKQNFTLDQLHKQIDLPVGQTGIALASDNFATASKTRADTGNQVTRGTDYVSIKGTNFTSIIKYTGEALVYSGDEAVHRHVDGSYWYQKGKDGLEQKFDPSNIASVTTNADLQNAVRQLVGLVDQGNGQIAEQAVTLGQGVVQTQVSNKKSGTTATIKVDSQSSSVTVSNPTDSSTKAVVTYVSTPESPEVKIQVDNQTVGSLKPTDDEIVVTTPDLVSTKEETTVSDGSVIHNDGSMELSSGIKVSRQGDIKLKDGTVIGHDNIIHFANGKTVDANQLSDQISATAAQAQGILASVSTGGGAVTIDQIIALECAIGQIGGLIDALNQLGDLSVVTSLSGCQASLETALDGAKGKFNQQSGRNFITNSSTTSEENARKYAFLTAA
jgi:hypothetical protein